MNHRQAIIDLGSNTARLVVFAYEPGQAYHMTDEIRQQIRLAEGMGSGMLLQPVPTHRAVEAMLMFNSFCKANDLGQPAAIATSAVRDAANQQTFLRRVAQEADLHLRVLNGQQEAYYDYLGVTNTTTLTDGILVDIGGGSIQLVEVENRQFLRGISLPLGAVRLTERFVRIDPIPPSEFAALERHITATLDKIDWLKGKGSRRLVGLGGSIRNIAKIDRRARGYPLGVLHGYTLSLDGVNEVTNKLRRLPLAQRAALPGLKPDRADVILAGAAVLRQLLRRTGSEQIEVCGHGLREGIFFEIFCGGQNLPLIDDVRRFSVFNLLYPYAPPGAPAARHKDHVTTLALALFDGLASVHGYGSFERDLVWAAAQLHDLGMQIDYYEHDKHTAYLILNIGLPGWTHRETALIAQLGRYHRRGEPDSDGLGRLLEKGDDQRLERLSALLRLAEYLERGRRQVITGLSCQLHGNRLTIRLAGHGDASVEIWDAERNLDLLRRAYGLTVALVPADLGAA